MKRATVVHLFSLLNQFYISIMIDGNLVIIYLVILFNKICNFLNLRVTTEWFFFNFPAPQKPPSSDKVFINHLLHPIPHSSRCKYKLFALDLRRIRPYICFNQYQTCGCRQLRLQFPSTLTIQNTFYHGVYIQTRL